MRKKSSLLSFEIKIVVVFCLLIVLGLLFLFVKILTHIDCENVNFYIVSKNNLSGETVGFYNETLNADNWEWDFGDKTKKQVSKNAFHRYKEAGIYIVTLTVNGYCNKQKTITIKKIQDLMELKTPLIICPRVAVVGDSVFFSSSYTGKVYSWEWSFGETANLDNAVSNPVYVYTTPGVKKISLIVNGNVKAIASQSIFVQPKDIYIDDCEEKSEEFKLKAGALKKDPAEEFIQKLPVIPSSRVVKTSNVQTESPTLSEEQFEILLLGISKQTKTKEDFFNYICGNYKMPVLKNNSEIFPFDEFCKNLKAKTIRIDALTLKRDKSKLNCIVEVSIIYKIKKNLIWIKD